MSTKHKPTFNFNSIFYNFNTYMSCLQKKKKIDTAEILLIILFKTLFVYFKAIKIKGMYIQDTIHIYIYTAD
jgi:hypothetical protein